MIFPALVSVVLQAVFVGLVSPQTATAGESEIGHPCDRTCVTGQPMSCLYTFTFEKYFTLSKECLDCPGNVTSCFRPQCTTGTGYQRLFFAVNGRTPGPLISVCEFDNIVVDVANRLGDLTTSIHWHGLLQRGTQYEDGVPYVTQCPIQPSTTYRYQFNANQSGTYFWHSHSSYQIVDGISGALIIRQPPNVDPNYNTYDFDLNEHVILIDDFYNVTGDWLHGLLFEAVVNVANYSVPSILVNGRGQGRMFPSGNGVIYTPVASFTVKQGSRYRFRLISNVNLPCPTNVSVDGHSLTIIATDGYPVQPTAVDAFFIYPGERYDFIINANQPIGNYWIRFQANGSDAICGTAAMGANLKYQGSADIPLTNRYLTAGRTNNTLIKVAGLTNARNVILPADPDVRFYLPVTSYLDFDPLHLPWTSRGPTRTPLINGISLTFPSSPLLSQLYMVNASILCNETSLQADGRNCNREYCSCVYRLKIPLNFETEVVLVNIAVNKVNSNEETAPDPLQHDFHLHGFSFYVVAQGTLPLGNDMLGQFKTLDQNQQIRRKLVDPVEKDTVGVLPGGYSVFRFKADNPGFWLFHCHVGFHLETGMGLIFEVGDIEYDVPPVPPGFPRCGDYLPPIYPPMRYPIGNPIWYG